MFECVYDRTRSTSVLGSGSLLLFGRIAGLHRSMYLAAICSISDELRNRLPVNQVAFTPNTWLSIKLYSAIFRASPAPLRRSGELLV